MTDDELLTLISGRTLTSKAAQLGMINALRYVAAEDIPGDAVECGVWQGGNIILARKLLPDRVCWLYDTFTGMTEPGIMDTRRSGSSALNDYHLRKEVGNPWCAASVEEVLENLKVTGTFRMGEGLRLVVGDVLETLLRPDNLPEKISLLRLDTDWYASTLKGLEVLYPLLSPGGVLICDDYGHWLGARQACDEYLGNQVKKFQYFDYTTVMLVKPC